jgi:iron complex outermembrane receptor protein
MKQMKILTGLVLMMFFISICYAQPKYSATIKDDQQKAVSGATVHLLNTQVTVVSDDAGRFSFPILPKGIYSMEISSIGYARLERKIQLPLSNDSLIIPLVPSAKQLDAVVVTAEKQEANIQNVPVSITALSSRDIQAYRLWASRDLKGIVSNLYAADPGDGRNVISIRGITSTSYDPAVVTYIDGVPQFTLDTYIPQLFDIDHIDVLKGPQGTLYGRNAMGGVINIFTKQPDDQARVSFELSSGNYSLERYALNFSAPIIKGKLFLGAAVLYEGSDGYYINDFNNSNFDKQYRTADNFYLKYQLNSKWSFTLNMKNLWNHDNGAFPLAPTTALALSNPYHLNQNAIGAMVDNTLNTSLQIHHFGTKMDFTSLTAYQSNYRYYKSPVDGDFSPLDIISIVNDYGKEWNKVNAWTEELRLSSAAASSSHLKWALGSYLFIQSAPNKQGVHFGADAALAGSPDSNYTIINTTQIKNKGLAFYGQLEYALSKKFSVAGGLRYDYQHSAAEVSGLYLPDGSPTGFPTQPDTSGNTSYNALTPMLSVTYRASENAHIYASYRQGYRTGGLTQLSSDPSQPPLYAYQPEYSNNFELGLKSNYFEDRFHANLAVFYNTVRDVQVPTLILPDAITVIKNAGGLVSKGFDADLEGLILPGLAMSYHYGYTHATYTSGKLSSNGDAVALDGKHQLFTPDMTSMLALEYSGALPKLIGVNGFIRGEWYYFGKQYFDLSNKQVQTSYQMLNASVGISYSLFSISVWLRNVTNTHYIAYAYDFGASRLGDPYNYGVSMKFRFR